MTKKTWIKIKRDLLEPKHQEALKASVWLFMLLIDRADWETGIVHGYTDRDAAEALGRPDRTIQGWRQEIEKAGYITCEQIGTSQDIQIHNWTNPREYDGKVYARRTKGPASVGGTSEEGGNGKGYAPERTPQGEGYGGGYGRGYAPKGTPSISSHSTSQGSEEEPIATFTCPKCGSPILEEHRGTPMELDCRLHRGMARQRR